MHPAVPEVWVRYNEDLEGRLKFMYADVDNWITTGMGNKVDPVGDAVMLPWRTSQNNLASKSQVVAAWNAVKNDPHAAKLGWTHAKGIPGNNLHLADEDVDALIEGRLRVNDSLLKARFINFEEAPADAQLGLHSMVWAMGFGRLREFPRFCKAFDSADWNTCAAECRMQPDKGTVSTRNRRNAICFLNAATVGQSGASAADLIWAP